MVCLSSLVQFYMHMESGKVRILITYSLFIHGRWIINNNLSITKLHSRWNRLYVNFATETEATVYC